MSVLPYVPNIAAVQTTFTGRLYNWDLLLLYRALSGDYPTYPSMIASGLGISLHHDIVRFLGTLGPQARFQYVGDIYSVIYNELIERDLKGFPELSEDFWVGWKRYTELLHEDARAIGEPLPFPSTSFEFPRVKAEVSARDRFIYAIYVHDVDTMSTLIELLNKYIPETVLTLPALIRDLDGILGLYTEWARERFLQEPAGRSAKVMAKSILLADYRWYLLAGDLLTGIEPALSTLGFKNGITRIGQLIRLEAEAVSL